MTEEAVRELCPQAENITITQDGTIAMKVGRFAQSIGIRYNKDSNDWQESVSGLYHDLLGMNRQVERQEKLANDNAGKTR